MNEPQLSAEMERIKDHCQCKHCVDGAIHSSDCAVHNEPADENGECNCEAVYISVFSEDLSYYWNWWFGDGWTNDKDKYHLFLLVKKELATALEEQATRHAMLMAGLEAQIEQKAVIRASELVDKARADEREKVLEYVAIKIKTYFGYLSNDGVTGKPMDIPLSMMEFDLLSFLSEVKTAKLNQLKQDKKTSPLAEI